MTATAAEALVVAALAAMLPLASASQTPTTFTYVSGSTTEVCQLTGPVNKATAQQYGLIAADRGCTADQVLSVDTFVPYGQVILKSTIAASPAAG
jgi:hypothetical protein